MRNLALLLLAAGSLLASGADSPAAEGAQDGFVDFVHRTVVANVPRKYEDLSEWGATIPAPAVVRFPRLKRTVIKVGDRYEVPHGTWKRTKVWIEDPAKDLRIRAPEVRRVGKTTTRLRVEATAAVRAERERRQWVNGVLVVGVTADADAVVAVGLDLDVTLAFDPTRPLAGMKFGVKVAGVRIDLKEFDLRRVGPVVLPEHSALGEELKGKVQAHLRTLEPRIRDEANRAIGVRVAGEKALPSAPRSDRAASPP
jgi:hypothetical protein